MAAKPASVCTERVGTCWGGHSTGLAGRPGTTKPSVSKTAVVSKVTLVRIAHSDCSDCTFSAGSLMHKTFKADERSSIPTIVESPLERNPHGDLPTR